MHDYLFTSEVVRFAFVFGVATSMLLYERRHLTTGSIVVPGYVATFAVFPLIIAATAVNAAVSYLLVNKVLNRWFLLYGRSKFTVLALISIAIQTVMLKVSPSGAWLWESDIKLVVGVGYVVPALIAHDMGRQGVRKTIRSVSLASVIVLAPIAFALLIDLPGVNDLAPLTGGGRMAIDAAWIPIAVLLSAAGAWGVSHNYGLRSGGFMGASFIAILLGDPWQVGVAISLALGTYLVVTKVMMDRMILFGRRKFSAMLLVSATVSWIMLWTGTELLGIDTLRHVDVGALALTPLIVPGLVANDAQRTGPGKVLAGLGIATVFVLCTTWWIQSLVQGSQLLFGWKLLSLGSFATIFWPQLSPARFTVAATRPSEADVIDLPATAAGGTARDQRPAPVVAVAAETGRHGDPDEERADDAGDGRAHDPLVARVAPLPRRQATDTSLAPTGPMIGTPALVTRRPGASIGGDTRTPAPAARVRPANAAPAGRVAPLDDLALPLDDAADAMADAAADDTSDDLADDMADDTFDSIGNGDTEHTGHTGRADDEAVDPVDADGGETVGPAVAGRPRN